MSEWIEILISKEDCSYIVAEQILNLTLTGLVNETTGEEGIIYLYDANSMHAAALMNLPYDVLKIIPMPSTYKNSPTGSSPRIAERLVKPKLGEFKKNFKWWDITDWAETFSDWWDDLVDWFNSLVEDFLKLLSDLVAFVLETIAAAAEAIAETAKKVAEAGLKLVEAVVRAAMAVLEQLLKAALLILIWTVFTITFIMISLTFTIITPLMIILFESRGYIYEINSHSISIIFKKDDKKFSIGYDVATEYYKYLDTCIPAIEIFYSKNTLYFNMLFNYFFNILSLPSPDLFKYLIPKEGPMEPRNATQEEINQFLDGWAYSMGTFGSISGLAGGISAGLTTTNKAKAFSIILILSSSFFFIIGWMQSSPTFLKMIGLILGIVIAMLLTMSAMIREYDFLPKKLTKLCLIMMKLATILSVISLILSAVGLIFPDFSILINSIQIVFSFPILIGGIAALHVIPSADDRQVIASTLFIIELFTILCILEISDEDYIYN
ncbi:MAG: hypothetical protein ACP6IY_20770 [Promethearchaeia archaeon]